MIYIPDICGTCKGATKALGLVYEVYEKEALKDNPKDIYIYKEILHNEKVVKELNDLGILIISDLSELTENDIVILRAHGEGKEVVSKEQMNIPLAFKELTLFYYLYRHFCFFLLYPKSNRILSLDICFLLRE